MFILFWLAVLNFLTTFNSQSPIDILPQEKILQENIEQINEENNINAIDEELLKKVIEKELSLEKEENKNIPEIPVVQSKPPVIQEPLKAENLSLVIDAPKVPKVVFQFQKPPNIFNNISLGEFGVAVHMPKPMPKEIKDIYNEGKKKNSFNQYLSDLISFHREVPDDRPAYCKDMMANYSKILPKASVIIIFHNEAWSTLLRSVHSVLDRSPEHLIEEVILVDDYSDMGENANIRYF